MGLIRYADATIQAKHFLEMSISPALDGIASEKTHKLDAKVPVITIKVGDTDNETKVDVSFNRVGLLKTHFIHNLYDANKNIFPLLWILVRWARSVGLIKSGGGNKDGREVGEQNTSPIKSDVDGLIASAEFYALVINLLKLSGAEEKGSKRSGRGKRGGKQVRYANFFVKLVMA